MPPVYPASFGKYILLKPLAHGGMGDIYLALTGEVGGFEKLCVIKRLRATTQNESAVRRFLDEAKLVIKLSHGSLVQVFDAGFVDDEVYLAMEYVEGRDLRELLVRSNERRQHIPLEVALYIAVQICRGLDYAHTYGDLRLVHRDICPSNVLLSFFGEVKVTDFGLAHSTLKEELTEPGKVFGRFSYLAPEQAFGQEADCRTDIYATAIILWELLVGQQMRPGPHTDPGVALSQARAGKVTPPSARNPAVPAELDAIVVKGLQLERDRRYATAEEMRQALAKVLARLSPTFDSNGVAAFIRTLYGDEIDEARREREDVLAQNYDRLRKPSGLMPSSIAQPGFVPISGKRPGEVENLAGVVVDGRYRVLRLIGEGGMGGVYEAEHVEIGRRVALKILHAIFSSHPETVARFRAEARAATRIGQPNIVEVLDSGTTGDGRVYFVMELLTGVDLARVMAENRIVPAARALAITLQICKALHAAHEAGIIHRDLKPENIFLSIREGQQDFVKILDFGIAKNVELGTRDDRLTHPGIAMGTPEYMAPEQAAGMDVDRRIDVYATGALLYEMLTGHLPHEGDNMMQVLSQKLQDAPPARQFRPDLPEELERVLARALASNRDARYATMADLAEALQPVAAAGTESWDVHDRGWSAVVGTALSTPGPSAGRAASPPALAPSTEPPSRRASRPGLAMDPTVRAPIISLTAAPTESGEPARVVTAGQVKLSNDQMAIARVKLPMGPASELAETQAAPAVRVRPRWITPAIIATVVVVMLGGVGAIAWWSRSHPVTTPQVDAAAVVVRPDAAPRRPDSGATSRPRAKMTAEEVERMLEWTKRAADGGRYFKPDGDNVIELLGLIEQDYPGHEGASALRQELCRRLEKSAKRAERRRRYALAARALENWLALDPENAGARAHLARLELVQGQQALARGNTKQAMTHAKAAQGLFPDSAAAAELRGDIAYKRKKYAAALKHYEGALEVQDLGATLKKRLEKKAKHLRRWVH